MNLFMRSSAHVSVERANIPPIPESQTDIYSRSTTGATLESFISEDPYTRYSAIEEHDGETSGVGSESRGKTVRNSKDELFKHSDVSEEEGWITIPYKEIPENWNLTSDIESLRSLDRSFLFPGEQIHILACLSACNQDNEIITPFKIAAVMIKNGMGHSSEGEHENVEHANNLMSEEVEMSPCSQETNCESLVRMEEHKRRTELLLQKFENSHFFMRITESDEPLWSKRDDSQNFSKSAETNSQKASTIGIKAAAKKMSSISTIIDRGKFDAPISSGMARNTAKCFALPNGDIAVLLQVNVGVNLLRDPYIEILQFEKFDLKILSSENKDNSFSTKKQPCEELLKWLLPLDNTTPSPARSLLPPHLGSNSGNGITSQRSNYSTTSGSQLFSHFRSYSMSSLPHNKNMPTAPVIKAASSKPSFDLNDWDPQRLFRKNIKVEELLSFRGVSLERERFSVRCGLEGIYTPGRRWRRKIEIIQPVEIHSFNADCNSEDLLCVQIKNVAPAHASEIVIFVDAISLVFGEAADGGPPSSLPIACIEAGNDHSLPNLSLRRGEEHSFILKPAISMWKNLEIQGKNSQSSKLQFAKIESKLNISAKNLDRRKTASIDDKYAIMVSCRCNYTASRLFFKQPTSWQPRTSKDIMISVASEMSGQCLAPNESSSQLPVQVLTLQVSNLTSEDLTLTVLAPASFTSLPSVVSLNSPTTPVSPFVGFTECLGRGNSERNDGEDCDEKQRDEDIPQTDSINGDIVPHSDLICSHLWLHSRVPLGSTPSQSSATIKLELLPLIDGIIILDTLQIDVKEKGVTYVPECSLKVNATSSIFFGD